ncbi:MAG TPA: glycosyltransferase family 87 protein [Gemmataceae bacterium]|nr:glycosyltransferase family 87 protein [Gemmataceae bacterium]
MAPPVAMRKQSRPWAWLRAHPYTAAAAVAVVALAVPFCLRRDAEWDQVYLLAARHLRQGADIYAPQDGYLYPPFTAWAALPFTFLPGPAARAAWLLLNVLCAAALVRGAWRLAGGPRLEGAGGARRGEHLAAVLGACCGLPYVQNCAAHQQTDLIIGALLVGGCLLLGRSRALAAAACFGVAAAMKCTALLWAPVLLWRRRPAAAAWLLAVALGVNLLPDLYRPSPSGRPWLVEYGQRFLSPLTEGGHYLGTWGSHVVYNQSLSGAGLRWVATTWTWGPDDCTVDPRTPLVGPLALRGAVCSVELLLLLGAAWACARPFRRLDAAGPDGERHGLECAVVLLLMLLLSPMSSKAHFGTLLVPGFCLARAALAPERRAERALLSVAVALSLAVSKGPLGERLYTLGLWYGAVTWQSLALLAGCLIALRRPSAAAAALPHAAPAACAA